MSFSEPIALRGHVELDEVASATSPDVRAGAETQFIERLRAGEATAFNRLVEERSGDVYALLYRLTEDPEEARDLTQETFLRAFQSISRFRGEADLRTWLYRIALNQARNRWRWWRRRRREATVSLDNQDGDGLSIGSRLRDVTHADPEQEALARERETMLRSGATLAHKVLSRGGYFARYRRTQLRGGRRHALDQRRHGQIQTGTRARGTTPQARKLFVNADFGLRNAD